MNPNNTLHGTALYSLPDATAFYEVSGPVSAIETTEIFRREGFVFAPFDHDALPLYHISGQPKITDPAVHHFRELKEDPYPEQTPVTREGYQKMFEESIALIQDGKIDKIVLSVREPEVKQLPSLPEFLLELRKAYPHAFIFAFYIPGTEFWVGATPELLLDTQYPFQRTVALAGTMRNGSKLQDWGEKERIEHHFVELYLERILKGKPYRKEGPAPVEAGPVHHLCTNYYIHMESLPINPVEIHPSPALSGFPVTEIIDHIRNVEPHDRRYYTGFLGPVWNEGHNKFFINLRCLEIFEDKVALYAGGGLTADSDSQVEWEEIRHKLSTLRAKFHKGEKV